MQYTYPYTIESGGGEKLTFIRLVKDGEAEYVEAENFVTPRKGPPMHVHYKQEESMTVIKGRIGVQVMGQEPEYYEAGETTTFKPGVAHKFWNAGNEPLICKGYVKPAHNIVYYLTEIYKSIKENGGGRPGAFDAAYLLNRYKGEYDIFDIPVFVKKVIFPIILFFGKLTGKHKKFANAPEPIA